MAILITKSKGNVYALIERMNKMLLVILCAGIICSCTSNTIMKKPDDLISKDQMVDLLTDMYTAVSAEHIKNINEKRNVNYFQLIFDKYQIDSSQFKRSSFYYSSKIDEYDKILEQVEKNIKGLSSEFRAKTDKADSIIQVKKDSLRQVKKDSLKNTRNIRRKLPTLKDSKIPSKVN